MREPVPGSPPGQPPRSGGPQEPGRGEATALPLDPIERLLHFPTLKRLFRVALFAGLLVLFRRLLVLLVLFIAFERSIGAVAGWLSSRTRLGRKAAIGIVALLLVGLLAVAIGLGAGRAFQAWLDVRGSLPERIAAFRDTDLYHRVQERLDDAGNLVEGAQHYAASALRYLATIGHFLLFVVIALILAVVYLLERDGLDEFSASQDPGSTSGTLLRWTSHLADAISVTLQFQVVVAAVNAVLTFPVLLLVGIPHAAAFLFMVFFSGMVPVVGNFVAGAILCLLAYQARGFLGVGIFLALTFVLHKIEAYYLNPRLAARHVRLPGFVLIVSLLLWEQLVGFAGLFISFPFLYLAARIRDEFRREDEARAATAEAHPTARS